ncbi:MAG TPA: hypothetical protein VHQ00_12320, partial [Chloroflexota bacterium]|nr:hypothetical protein [Chloroflexota bacterium]
MTQTPPPAESAPPGAPAGVERAQRATPEGVGSPTPFEPVLTVAMGQPESWTMARYRARGGYDGARK